MDEKDNKKRLTRGQAIRAKCLDCSGFQPIEVKLCPVVNCPLWVYRLGYEVDESNQKTGKAKKQEKKIK